jgi:CheY-like chemotaxis protein
MHIPTVLIIEDDPDDQEMATQLLHEEMSLKCNLEFCENGAKALEYLSKARRHPRLIVSDINMPGINGLELKKKINEDQRLRDMQIPFVFMTTAQSTYMIKTAEELHVHGYFSKGNTLEEYKMNLKMILSYWCRNRVPLK